MTDSNSPDQIMFHNPFIAGILPAAIEQNLGWIVGALIVVGGVLYGLSDVMRLSWRRISAIGGVCFWESARRRVWLIPPLAILGVIIVSQLQRPLDEQDAIRQTIKFCLFACGLVVATTTIILACTSLPREIENRVIYTVVTKPTTRLEIVLGKVLGFAMVSGAILLIMGAFTSGYLGVRAWNMQRYIAERLEGGQVSESTRSTLEHYQRDGLLNAKTLAEPRSLQIFSRLPELNATRKFFGGGGEGSVTVPFVVTKEEITPRGVAGATPGAAGVGVTVSVGYVRKADKNAATQPAPAATTPSTTASTHPEKPPYYGPYLISPEERQKIMAGVTGKQEVVIGIEVLDRNRNYLGNAQSLAGQNVPLALSSNGQPTKLTAVIAPTVAEKMADQPVYLRISAPTQDVEYFVDKDFAYMAVPSADGTLSRIEPAGQPMFEGRQGTYGQQLKGAANGPVAVIAYKDAAPSQGGQATFEMRSVIERSGAEAEEHMDEPTTLEVRVRNLASGNLSEPVIVTPESNRQIYFNVPAAALAGGNYELVMRCTTPGHFVGLGGGSVAMIAARQPFVWNLFKSLLILWMMAILITTIAIFCSTWLSWPIAVVLTIVLLLSHWGVDQLGDAIQPGIGNAFVNDMGFTKSAQSKAISATVEKLSSMLNFLRAILPDISKFAAVEDIERGVSISLSRLGDASIVAIGFGIPLIVLAYAILRNKEVAP